MASCSSAARVDFEFSDPCYVFRAIRSPDCSHVAASLSNGNIKTYSCSTAALVAVGDLAGAHGAPTSDIAFPLADSAHALYSCSRDGMIKGWDLRAMQQAEQYQLGPGQELFSFCLLGDLMVGGGQGDVHFWDRRTRQKLACWDDMHMDDVTQVAACPGGGKLLTASQDGLIAVHNTAGGLHEDEGFESALNVGTSVEEIGFYGNAGERLWVRTGTETLQLWEWRLATQEGAAGGDVALADFAECRAAAAAAAASCPAVAAAAPFAEGIDYLATCHWDAASQQLLLAAGSNTGAVGFFPVREERPGAGPNSDGVIPMQAGVVQAPLVVLAGTHSDVVRSVSTFDGPAAAAGLLCVTGGEDARVCLWSTSQPPWAP